jgi:DNA polymerase III delta subunit
MEIKSYLLEKQTKANPESFWEASAYLFVGEESFLKEDFLSFVVKALKLGRESVLRLDAATVSGEEVLSTLNTYQMSDDRTVIVIDNADKIPNEICQRLYDMWEKNGFPIEILPVFIADSVTNRKLWGLVKEEGVWCKFWQMFSNDIPRWTLGKMHEAKIKAEKGVEYVISHLCNFNLRQIVKEIEKLALTDAVLTEAVVKQYIRGIDNVDRFMLDDKLVKRELVDLHVLLEKVLRVTDTSPKDVVMSFGRLTRHAIQAQYYVNKQEQSAGVLVNLAKQLIQLDSTNDWQTISKRIDISKSAASVIDSIPMLEKMSWTGKLAFTVSNDGEEAPEPPEQVDKKRRKKLLSFDTEQEARQAEIEAKKEKRKWEESEMYNHNIWYQKNTFAILKAFYMATVYTEQELQQMLLTFLRTYQLLYSEGELLMRERLECFIAQLSAGCLQLELS